MSMHAETMTLIKQAQANLESNNLELALNLLKKANDLSRGDPELQSSVYFETAKSYAQAGKDDTAATLVKQALKLNQGLCSKANAWAVTLERKGKKKLAQTIIACIKAQDISSGDHIIPIDKPGKVTAIGGMRIGSGVCNIIAGLAFCWLIFPAVLIPLGILEIVSAGNLLKSRPERPTTLKTFPILEIIAILTLAGWISLVVGIISLAFLADTKVKKYFESL